MLISKIGIFYYFTLISPISRNEYILNIYVCETGLTSLQYPPPTHTHSLSTCNNPPHHQQQHYIDDIVAYLQVFLCFIVQHLRK